MNRNWVLAEWRRAVEALGAANMLLKDGYPTDSVSRSYYAVLHAGKAVLAVLGIEVKTHAALRSLFGAHLIRPGRFEKEWAEVLGLASDDRLAADYDVFSPIGNEKAAADLGRAEAFLRRVRTHLSSEGIVEKDLDEFNLHPPSLP